MFFLKFSDDIDHLSSFVNKGHVYINNFEYFAKHEDAGHKYDRHELASRYHQHIGASLTLDGKKFKIAEPFSIRLGDVIFSHIFCLCAVTEETLKKTSDKRVFDERLWRDFGEYIVLIHNPREFLSRLVKKINELKYYCEHDFVQYFCPITYEGEVGAFRKRNIYDYQCEYRIAINSPVDGPLDNIYLGDLSDIAHGPVHKSQSINRIENDNAKL
ncbi:MAG TPA: hypothetical protein DER40_02355 [Geobacter sp.]|nr:MAG: hypothetical protein A2X85_06870 [Geobacteraceae bacterium GWF2_54_21]HBA71675.1 hypothetical protein [Geobacter sp.]HCE66393.1 hypothetical protein [Geobacter sp.]